MTGRSISSLLDVQERFERFRTWPRLWSRVDRPTEELLTYWQLTAYLYEAIHRTAGKPIIVDSSKSSTRAFALVCNPFVDSRVLHLVRDGRGYVWSMRKAFKADLRRGVQHNMPAISSWRSSGRWVLGNVTSEVVTRRAPLNARRMKYEDLLADPASFFAGIGDLIDVDVSEVVEKLKEGSSLKTSHVVAGNRVRMAEKVIFKPDLAWRENLSKWDEVIFWIIGGLLAIKYGYHVDGARTG